MKCFYKVLGWQGGFCPKESAFNASVFKSLCEHVPVLAIDFTFSITRADIYIKTKGCFNF